MKSNLLKKIIILLLFSLLLQSFYSSNNSFARVLWPSAMNLQNEAIDLDKMLPETATSSESKKGLLFISDAKDIFTLGAGHIAINVNLSGKAHTFMQLLEGLKKRGIKITIILCNDTAPVGIDLKNVPDEYKKPYFYMMDFNATNGEWQRLNFQRIVDDYGDYVDNWILGNEINCQTYNFYGPANIEDYTKVYCNTFRICYEKIKNKNPDANVYISFDQGWNLPAQIENHKRYDKIASFFRYNMRKQLHLINEYLDKNIDWGVALHPYPAPVSSAAFWDDDYAGFDDFATEEKDRPYLNTLKNFEFAIDYLSHDIFLKEDKSVRNIIVSEFGITSNDGERQQAAALYYVWQKIENNPLVKCFLYNAQTDLDEYKFGLTNNRGKKRLAWAVFKDMDREDESAWCKDLLDEVLEENGFVSVDGTLVPIASISELLRSQK